MPKINILDKHTAELIAAGEVVERPASVIKELVENSIDAGATTITVEIQNGGTSYLRVTDNGSGIEKEDVKNAFLRHATSKIRVEADLDSIGTLGFRGEALAAISSVANVELLTRTVNDKFGTRYLISGGEEKEFDDAGCQEGTTIIVRDLFFNTPARKKFLKKDVSEGNAVSAVMDKIALSHANVSIRLLREGKETLQTPGDGALKSAIYAVLGKEFASSIIPVNYEMNGIKVTGFVSKPLAARANRNNQTFFLNSRYVRTKTAMAALEEAYKNSIMVGKFPSCVLNIEVDFSEVDVNVHPAKIEVRFSDERSIFSAVYYAVKTALSSGDTRPQMEIKAPLINKTVAPMEQIKISTPAYSPPPPPPPAYKGYGEERTNIMHSPSAVLYQSRANKINLDIVVDDDEIEEKPKAKIEKTAIEGKKEEPNAETPPLNIRYIGEAFDTYIIAQVEDSVMLIDKHATHERILFDKLSGSFSENEQTLLSPVTVVLPSEEYDAILSNLDKINETGFQLEDFGSKTILVRSVPMSLHASEIKGLIEEIAGKLANKNEDFSTSYQNWLLHNVSCRAAIKAGNKSTIEELENLLYQIAQNKDILYCPHGRPTAITLTKAQIEKQFGRG